MNRVLASLVLALPFAAVLRAQPAAYTFFGTDCQSVVWQPPPFTNLTLPRLGTTLVIQTHSSSGGIGGSTDAYLITGVSRTTWGGLPLPFDLSVFSGPGILFCGNLYVSGEIILRLPHRGLAPQLEQVPFSIPNLPALLGARFFHQVLQNVTAPHDNEWYLTRAGEAAIGR